MEKKDPKTIVDEKTLLPVGLLITILTALILGIVHVQDINSTANAASNLAHTNQAEIKSLNNEDKEIKKQFNDTLVELNTRLARIEGAMGIKDK